ncbi:bifunctional phosphoribosylaminoimidazolecarboxamide formyltransferase/IMP cyclohydrolase [Sulfurihydrogenibium azorense]|uniref:bifunctional phosphoribosylaminoimidazolecarboxamide formyltransferase/IMP cyclohydrolase n=1 Tax=Sulfurihydrogenibium azorense TaxID=309806 RepID=UPI00391989B0
MKRALISVSNKTGVIDFARELVNLGYEIVSSSGTAKYLKENGINVIEVSQVTGFPEILDGRVKTLHPKIHGGILAVRDNPSHLKQLQENGITPIDIVAINLYPFEETVKKGADLEEIIENIDIGGPAMVRASAKNYKYVAIITDPSDYDLVINELKTNGEVSLKTRQLLSLKAFRHTALYDSIISNILNEKFGINEDFPHELTIPMRKKYPLRYGENPHQKACLYLNPIEEGLSVANAKIIQGKEMSYNNYLDVEASLLLVKEFENPACVIVKHNNPCGVAEGDNITDAYRLALQTDPRSAFGGIVAFNREVDGQTAKVLTELFLEVVVAPSFSKEALEIFSKKKNLRVVEIKDFEKDVVGKDVKRLSGGYLLQDRDKGLYETLEVVTERKPTEKELEDLIFALKVVKHVKSNAVVIAKDKRSIGIGVGQTSRVDSLETAVKKAQEFGLELEGSVLASEAFFPFRDSIDFAAKYGIKAVIQPGGSIRDNEVIQACNEYSIAMIFTKMRHFKH